MLPPAKKKYTTKGESKHSKKRRRFIDDEDDDEVEDLHSKLSPLKAAKKQDTAEFGGTITPNPPEEVGESEAKPDDSKPDTTEEKASASALAE